MMRARFVLTVALFCAATFLSGCGGMPASAPPAAATPPEDTRGIDVVVFALGLVETGYRFGGKNPDAGFDCSGMVSYVYNKAAGLALSGSASDIARQGRAIGMNEMRPGDLVFFAIDKRSHAHVGIYIGDRRFVHAPSGNGKVRTDSLGNSWFATRFEEARSYFN